MVALLAIGAAAGSAAAKSCTYEPIPLIYIETEDLDSDLLNDSFWMETQYAPAPPEQVWLNVTVMAPNGSLVDLNISWHSTDDLNYTYERYAFALANTTDTNGTYRANVTFDYTNGSCSSYDYDFELFPPGVYQPAISGATLSETAEINSTVIFELTVTNEGNNPDSFSFYVVKGLSWTVLIDNENPALGPGASTTVNVSVVIPLDAAPLAVDALNITVSSARLPGRRAYIDLVTTVNAQVFAFNMTADNNTQAGYTGDILTFGFHATNLGNNRDTLPLTFPTGPSGWTATATVGALTLYPGESADFQVAVRLPSSYADGNWWNFTVALRAGDGVTNRSIILHARLFFPDFVLGPAGIVANTSAPNEGDAVAVQVIVYNIGAPIAVTFAVTLQDSVRNYTVIIDMPLSGSTNASFHWTAIAGLTTLVAFADSTNSVPEDDESNNRGSLAVTANLPPLAATANATDFGHPGQPVAFSAAGSSDLDGSVAAYFFAFGDGTDSGWVTQPTITHTYNASGNYTLTLKVRDNRGKESAPATEKVVITPGETPNGGGGGSGGGGGGGGGGSGALGAGNNSWLLILLVGLVAAAVAAALVWRRRAPKQPGQNPPPPPPVAP